MDIPKSTGHLYVGFTEDGEFIRSFDRNAFGKVQQYPHANIIHDALKIKEPSHTPKYYKINLILLRIFVEIEWLLGRRIIKR